jgi:hypothetical protein
MWVLSITFLFVSAVWASTVSTRIRRAVAVGIALCLVAVGWWVSGVLDRVWTDACDFGTGSGDRCIAGGGAPGWVPWCGRRSLCSSEDSVQVSQP